MHNYKITLSSAKPVEKSTTYGFNKTEVYSLEELQNILNTKAVSNGLYLSGHRNQNYLKAMGNIYILDFDIEPLKNMKAYYLKVEEILKEKEIAFVSVPSKSASEFPYKRHIVIILSECITHIKDKYSEFEQQLLSDIGIDITQIDQKLMKNRTSHIAPASINKLFTDYNSKSNYYCGIPYQVNKKYFFKNKKLEEIVNIDRESFIDFADGSRNNIEDTIKILPKGSKKSCYCPKHNDTNNPSATFFYNDDGSVRLNCQVCGKINIGSNFLNANPKINHYQNNYSIKVYGYSKKLIDILGEPSVESPHYEVWSFRVENINHIYQIMLAKKQLIEDGFKIDKDLNVVSSGINLKNTNILTRYIANTKLLTVFIKSTKKKLTSQYIIYFYAKKYVFNNFINVETIIWFMYQNLLNINCFETICHYGLSYYEYILQTIETEKNLPQKDKRFSIRLNRKQKKEHFKSKEESRMKKVKINMHNNEKRIFKLMKNPEYHRNNGYNKSKIATKLGLNRNTVSAYIKRIEKNK